jgi:hypothetical protein
MGKTIDEVAAVLRVDVLMRRYPGKDLPSERTIATRSDATRHTVRLALEVLKTEGLVKKNSVDRWELTDSDRDAAFTAFEGFIDVVPPNARPGRVRQLLAFRRRHFVGAVDARLVSGSEVTSAAKEALDKLRYVALAESVLAAEDELMTMLMLGGDNLFELLAAHQLRRAMEKVRGLLDLDFVLYPNVPGFMALVKAWDAGDRPAALRLADRVATEREAIYVRLMENAAVEHSPAIETTH